MTILKQCKFCKRTRPKSYYKLITTQIINWIKYQTRTCIICNSPNIFVIKK
jgi:hypothetical protein